MLFIIGAFCTIGGLTMINLEIKDFIDNVVRGRKHMLIGMFIPPVTIFIVGIFTINCATSAIKSGAEKEKNSVLIILGLPTIVDSEGAIHKSTVDILDKLTSDIGADIVMYNAVGFEVSHDAIISNLRIAGVDANILGIIGSKLKEDFGLIADVISWFNENKIQDSDVYKKVIHVGEIGSENIGIANVRTAVLDEMTVKKIKIMLSMENTMARLPRSINTCKYKTTQGISFGGQILQKTP